MIAAAFFNERFQSVATAPRLVLNVMTGYFLNLPSKQLRMIHPYLLGIILGNYLFMD
jgi:hypothetical protein